MWYLTEELLVLDLFCRNAKDETKEKIAKKLLSLDYILPKIPEKSVDTLDLSLFVGEDSWSIFSIMKLNYRFLSKPVQNWPKDDGYLDAKLIINNISVDI